MHFSMFHEGELLAVDLGLDTIFRYTVNASDGTLTEKLPAIHVPAGNGPRHFVFHPSKPELLYVLCELSGRVIVFCRNDRDEYAQLQEIAALPEEFTGENTAAAIRISADGRYLFTSNRGDDSIAVFRIEESGELVRLGFAATGGAAPRDFELFGALAGEGETESYLVAANQDSRELTVLRWDAEKEVLEQTEMKLSTQGRPVCILKTK